MNSIVIYGSHSGNTGRVAAAIADSLRFRGPVQLLPVEQAPTTFSAGADLVLVGGPTEAHRMTAPVGEFFARLQPGALNGVAGAAFGTRVNWPRWLSGSAANGISQKLQAAGARIIAQGEDFIVDMGPHLEPGELERAATWAATVADAFEASAPAAVRRLGRAV